MRSQALVKDGENVIEFGHREPGNNAAERRLLRILNLPQGFGVGLDDEDLLDDLISLAFDRQAESRS